MKKILVLLLILGMVVSSNPLQAATRQDIQVAFDVIKMVNIINDLLDCSVPIARGQVKIWDEVLEVERDMTVEEIKGRIKRTCLNIYGYRNKIDTFLAIPEQKQLAIAGLAAIEVNLPEVKNQYQNMIDETDYVYAQVDLVTNQAELNAIGDHIEANVPKLSLVRRAE